MSAERKPTFFEIVKSMLAAFAGIQNNANHDRDDAHIERVGFRPYIIAGIALTTIFVLFVMLVVRIILS